LRKAEELANRPYHPAPADLTHDWTGTKYAKYWKTYGKGPALA
jgi:hypothetical protein